MRFDVFISHASEDKDEVARPLALRLEELGLSVWLDECQLTVGDSLRRSIDSGLIESRCGIVVLSPAFFTKEWPNKELDGLVARDDGKKKVILPVWHQVTANDIRKFSPILADRIAISTSKGIDEVARSIVEAITAPNESPKTAHITAAEQESQLLRRLRTQMLTAPSSRELRYAVYELDKHLALYPNSPNARLLKDELVAATKRTECLESPTMSAPRSAAPPLAMRRVGCLLYPIAAILLAIIAYILFLIFT